MSHLRNSSKDDVAVLRFGVDVVYGAPLFVLDALTLHQTARV